MELLKGNNWMPWKRHMLAVLQDLSLKTYIDDKAAPPVSINGAKPTPDEEVALKKWSEGDSKARRF